jgi:hypothetical protein
VFNEVKYNEGGSYDNATGYFTVVVPGLYVFIASTGPYNDNTGSVFYLYVDNTQLDWSYAYIQNYAEMSSVHGVVHLQAGQRVWVKSRGNDTYYDLFSAFTGFLLSPDF